MPAATLISAAEYLEQSWRPDREFIEGQLLERNLGEFDHADLQTALATWLRARRKNWNMRVVVEQRIRVSASRFRIPDICVITLDAEREQVLTKPPLICIEILSKDDTLRSMQNRVDDYLALGVPNIWILDPASRRAYVCDGSGFHEPATRTLQASGSEIQVPLDEVFDDLD